MTTARLACIIVLIGAASAESAVAANRIEGTWAFGKGRVEITPGGGAGAYKGIVVRKLTFSKCAHPRGERMWDLVDLLDGSYRGRHMNYRTNGCTRDPGAPAIWRVRRKGGRDVLDFCANDPGSDFPSEFRGSNCRVLKRVAPARDLARVCASGPVRASRAGQDLCIQGPKQLRQFGCLPQGRGARHRFEVKLVGKRRGRSPVEAGARIRSVAFRIDGRAKGTDRTAPFALTVAGSDFAPGSHALVAKVLLRRQGGRKASHKRLTFRFDACP